MKVPEGLLYTKEHEWIQVQNGTGTVGITDHAQNELGDVVFVELPEKGQKVAQNETFGTVESVKAVSELYSPVSGEVSATNDKLVDSPEMINEDPYGEGWLIRVRLNQPDELEKLMSAEEYRQYTREEAEG